MYEAYATSPFTLKLDGKKVSWSPDRERWESLPAQAGACSQNEAHLGAAGRLYLRAE